MRHSSKKLLSLLLAFVLVMGLLPGAAFAEDALPNYTGDWTSFRGNPENNGVTNAKTPITTESASLKWAQKYGSGWSAAPTPPLILNGDLYIAVANQVLKIKMDTGKKIAESPAMGGNVGFALNPIAYGGGRIYVPLSAGQIRALRADTLELLWVSDKMEGVSQTNSPVVYHDGFVYTGIWGGEEKNGSYFCLNAETGEKVWAKEQMGGFYWAGAYVTDKYLVVGSGDSTPENSYTETAVLFSLDSKTGEVIDTIENLKGDIRSSVCYDDGKVYFATKGGWFCTVAVDDNGVFDDDSFQYVDLKGMCTGTPMVYNGRAYIGASGAAQFSGPGYLNVIDLSGETPELAYRAELPGYPQASALATGAYGDATYVYITYNQSPGGIYAIKDRPGQTEAEGKTLYTPDAEQQNYGICSLVCDANGTLYYKNDSCYLMAVSNNSAYLSGLTADKGTLTQPFAAGTPSYELIVPLGTEQVTLNATPCEGAAVTINGNSPAPISLTEGRATASIVVTHERDTRTYTVTIRETSDNAALSALAVNESNTFGSGDKALTPAFDAAKTAYACFGVGSGRTFVNLWPTAADPNATVKVYAVSNVDPEDIQEDGTLEITSSSGGHNRYAVYFADAAKPMAVRVEILAEDASSNQSYTVLMTKAAAEAVSYATTLTMERTLSLPSGTAALTATFAQASGSGTPEGLTWSSSNPAAATVDQNGVVTYVGNGVTTVTAAGLLTSASCVVTCGSTPTPGNTISVSFRLIGSTLSSGDVDLGSGGYAGASYQTWLKTSRYTLPKGATVQDLFILALDGAGLLYTGAEQNYVDSITAPTTAGGYRLSEFTNGPRSGWMYTVNGTHPGFGLKEWTLREGDKVVWHYVNDYSYEVADWFDDGSYPSLGDGKYHNAWLKAADTNPTSSSGGSTQTEKPATGLTPSATTDKNGEAKSTVSTKDMESAITDAKKNGTSGIVIEPTVKGSASKVSVELPREAVAALAKDSTTTLTFKTAIASISLPTAALGELGQTEGKTVAVSAETVKDENGKATGEVRIEVTTDGKAVDSVTGGLTVALPVVKATPGTVLMVITDEGAKIIKKSAVDGMTLTALLGGSATVVAKENSQTFADVGERYWGSDAVNFAASHELFQGAGTGSFAPDGNMSRAMLFTVLGRLEEQDTAGSTWYEGPMLWAKEQGISDGTNPDGSISREQLATMLYRYAEVVGVDTSTGGNAIKEFGDADKVSAWAVDAMAWAVNTGLISGKGGDMLDPAGTATRGEVAAMFQRLIPMLLK